MKCFVTVFSENTAPFTPLWNSVISPLLKGSLLPVWWISFQMWVQVTTTITVLPDTWTMIGTFCAKSTKTRHDMAERCACSIHTQLPWLQQTALRTGPRPLACLRLINERALNNQPQTCPLPQQDEYTPSTSAVWSNTDQPTVDSSKSFNQCTDSREYGILNSPQKIKKYFLCVL